MTDQNLNSIEEKKGSIFKCINNDKYIINNSCPNSKYIMQVIYLLVDKMNINDLKLLKSVINQKITNLIK